MAVVSSVLLVVLAWGLLTGMPFRERAKRPEAPEPVKVTEAPPPRTQPDLGVPPDPAAMPAGTEAPVPATTSVELPLAAVQNPDGITHGTALGQGAGPGEIRDTEAMAVIASRLRRLYPRVEVRCIEIRSQGYSNAGYTMELIDGCRGRRLDVWRVDSRTRELFRRQADGRFLAK